MTQSSPCRSWQIWGICGVQAGAAGDLVFVRAVKEDMRNAGVGMQTEVSRVVSPLKAHDVVAEQSACTRKPP